MVSGKSLFFASVLFVLLLVGCKSDPIGYNRDANASAAIDSALREAKSRNCNVLVQVGGEWCRWCVMLNRFIGEDAALHKSLTDQYVWLHVYYGKDNKNPEAMARLGDPTKYGFPVFIILSPNGEIIRTESTGVFESEEQGYSAEKLTDFFKTWASVRSAQDSVEQAISENDENADTGTDSEVTEPIAEGSRII